MDALFGGFLLALTLTLGTVHWRLLVHPERLLVLFGDAGTFFEESPASLRALRWATGAALLLLAFLTSLAWTFLVATARDGY